MRFRVNTTSLAGAGFHERKLQEAVKGETTTDGARAPTNADLVERVASRNVDIVLRQIVERSPILASMLSAGELALTGGIYDVETGRVEFHQDGD